jgi:hypothetical protein
LGIAWVWAYPVKNRADTSVIESALFHKFHPQSALMNGKAPKKPPHGIKAPAPSQKVQVMADAEIQEKRNPALRLPRQAEHYSQLVGYFLAVKNSKDIAVSIQAHFQRLQKYRRQLLDSAIEVEGDGGDD